MTVGERVAKEARSWIGTPFHWQASQKGVGADCKGLLWGVARELGRPEADSLYAQMADYGPRFDGRLLKEGIASLFDPVTELKPGDILLCKLGNQPGHLAIYTGGGKAVHTQISSKAWVKETDLRALYHFYPFDSAWRWRRKCRSPR
jgi:cell wall-associated NlpC family hydrolase